MNTYFLAKQFVECQVLNAQVLSIIGYNLALCNDSITGFTCTDITGGTANILLWSAKVY